MASKQQHILIIRLSAMGDVAMTVPVVEQLRARNPDLKITILTRGFFKPFFRNIPDLNFLEADFNGRHKGLNGLMTLFDDIRTIKVTHVADLHDVLRTKMLRVMLFLSGRKVSKIDKGRADKRALTRKFRKFKVQLKPTIIRYREAILRLRFRFDEPVPYSRERKPVPEEIAGVAGEKSGIWVGISPFAQHRGKIYPTELMAKVIEELSARADRIFIFGGGPYEREFADCMAGQFDNVVSVIGKISLDKELDLISNMDTMLSMDSSAMHMSSLVGVPVVSIWGATHPFAGFYGFGQDPDNAIGVDLECRPCSVYGNKPCMYGDYRCMEMISTTVIADKVIAMAKEHCS